MDTLTLAQMLCSRLCHDLITPIGAISSGFEILEDCDEEDRAKLMDLTRRSAETASRRLTFYRAAFGYSLASQHSTFLSIKQLMEGFLTPIKIHLEWHSLEALDQNKQFNQQLTSWGRLLMNIVLTGAEGMPYGGEIQITSTQRNPYFKINFKGSFVTVRPEVMQILKQNSQEETIQTPLVIQVTFVKLLAKQLQVNLVPDQINNEEFQIQVVAQQAKNDAFSSTNHHY